MRCAIRARKAIFGIREGEPWGSAQGIAVDDELNELAKACEASRRECFFILHVF